MNSLLTTLPPYAGAPTSTTVLSQAGYHASLHSLPPGAELPPCPGDGANDHILFVVEGEARVRVGDVTTILAPEQALHLPSNKEHTIVAGSASALKILCVDVPPRQVTLPPIVSFER